MGKLNQADVQALDILVSGTEDEDTNLAIRDKLGLNDDDIRAYSESRNVDPEIAEAVQTKIYDKIRSQKDRTGITQERAIWEGLKQGVTFKWSDEIESSWDTMKEYFSKGGDYSEIYERKVKKKREDIKALEKRYPLNFIASEIIGGLAVPIPGASLKSAATLGKLALESAATAAGAADAPVMSGKFLEQTAAGTAIGVAGGALLGGVAKGASKLVEKGASPTKKAAMAVSNILFDLPPAYTERLLDPRTAKKILDPKSPEQIVDTIEDLVSRMSDDAEALSMKAQSFLSRKFDIDTNRIVRDLNDLPSMNRIERSTMGEAEAAKKELDRSMADLLNRSKDGMISEKNLKQFIQDIDLEIPWNKNEWKLKDRILSEIRAEVDNYVLKGGNKKYAEAMIPVAEIMRNRAEISKSFSLKRKGYKAVPTDATFSKVRNFYNVAGKSKKPVSEKALAKADERYGKSILEDIEIGQIAARTEGGMAAGSKNVLLGLAMGSMFGASIWGAVAGAVKDKYGRKLGKQFIPKLEKSIKFSDDKIEEMFDVIDPKIVERVLQTYGRFAGSEKGVEGVQAPRPTSIIPIQQPSFGGR